MSALTLKLTGDLSRLIRRRQSQRERSFTETGL